MQKIIETFNSLIGDSFLTPLGVQIAFNIFLFLMKKSRANDQGMNDLLLSPPIEGVMSNRIRDLISDNPDNFLTACLLTPIKGQLPDVIDLIKIQQALKIQLV